jgi:hypothetical protein
MCFRTPAATAALSVATRFHWPALLSHCVRSYLWERMYGAHGIAIEDEPYCRLDVWREAGINYRTSRWIVDAADASAFEGFLPGRRRRRTHGDRQHGCQTQSDNHKQKAQRYGKRSPAA